MPGRDASSERAAIVSAIFEGSSILVLVARRAMAAMKQAERTEKLWADPLSIFAPDPLRLAVVMYNCGLTERSRDLGERLADLRDQIAALKIDNAANDGGLE